MTKNSIIGKKARKERENKLYLGDMEAEHDKWAKPWNGRASHSQKKCQMAVSEVVDKG